MKAYILSVFTQIYEAYLDFYLYRMYKVDLDKAKMNARLTVRNISAFFVFLPLVFSMRILFELISVQNGELDTKIFGLYVLLAFVGVFAYFYGFSRKIEPKFAQIQPQPKREANYILYYTFFFMILWVIVILFSALGITKILL